METGLDKAELTVERVTNVKDIPRTWRNAIPFGEHFDASVEDIVNGDVYDEPVERSISKTALIRKLLRDGKIDDSEATVLKEEE